MDTTGTKPSAAQDLDDLPRLAVSLLRGPEVDADPERSRPAPLAWVLGLLPAGQADRLRRTTQNLLDAVFGCPSFQPWHCVLQSTVVFDFP
jgi:hypothetical protein